MNDTIIGMAFDDEHVYETRQKRGNCLAYKNSSVIFERVFEGYVHWGSIGSIQLVMGIKYSEIINHNR